MRDGKRVRVYRRRLEQYGTYVASCVLYGIFATKVLTAALASPFPQGRNGVLLVIVLAIGVSFVVVWFVVLGRLGVEVAADGVRSVYWNGTAFVAWADVDRFVVMRYGWFSSCVAAELCHGARRVLLTALGRLEWTPFDGQVRAFAVRGRLWS
jgi:hypothetical protein